MVCQRSHHVLSGTPSPNLVSMATPQPSAQSLYVPSSILCLMKPKEHMQAAQTRTLWFCVYRNPYSPRDWEENRTILLEI